MIRSTSKAAGLLTHITRRTFTSSPYALKPQDLPSSPSRPSSSSSPPQPSTNEAIEEILVNVDKLIGATEDVSEASIFKSLPINIPHSPRSLSPLTLLNPFPPAPSIPKAYPLGVPKSLVRLTDPFHRLGLSPLESPMNPYFGGELTTTLGKIKKRGETGLGRKNQRRVGKAIRRGRSMGILSPFGKSLPGYNGR